MADTQSGIEGQLKFLTEKVASLQETVDELSVRLQTLEKGEPLREKQQNVQETTPPQQPKDIQAQPGVLKKAGTGSLLPRVAAVCFALVVALILRTITDNGIINIQLGSMLGLGYAAALIIGGWWLYSRLSRLALVFPACGLLLLFSVVLESHGRFESLSAVMAYIILFIGAAAVIALGLRYRASGQLCLAGLGTGLVG
ncbi:MAG: hypothetical protein WBF36_04265, partial [Desulfobulbales bacterium]